MNLIPVNCIRVFDSGGTETNEHWFTPAKEIDPENYITDRIQVGEVFVDSGQTILPLTSKDEQPIHLMDVIKITYYDRGKQILP